MKKVLCGLLGVLFALTSISTFACTGDKAKDGSQMSTPSKPKT